jgi:UDP-glucuronate 4-epimerase
MVTGCAGFIGYHVSHALLGRSIPVVGFDNITPYYDIALKQARLEQLQKLPNFHFTKGILSDPGALLTLMKSHECRHVVHLAAQAGVRHSIEQPFAYAESNLTGFLAVLEACRALHVEHLVYASSSSVYGGNVRMPFSASDPADHPVSLYAATKKANELMAHSYCHLYGFPASGLRFFTVYGPWGRPDMAYWKFADAIEKGRAIDLYNNGDLSRDFTYVDDIVAAILELLVKPAEPAPDFSRSAPDPARSWAPHRVFNIGASKPESVPRMIAILEQALGRSAALNMLPMQPGDVAETWADVEDLERTIGIRPTVSLEDGLAAFVSWFRWWHARQ